MAIPGAAAINTQLFDTLLGGQITNGVQATTNAATTVIVAHIAARRFNFEVVKGIRHDLIYGGILHRKFGNSNENISRNG